MMEEVDVCLRINQPGGVVHRDCDALNVHAIICYHHVITDIILLSCYNLTIVLWLQNGYYRVAAVAVAGGHSCHSPVLAGNSI